MKTLICSLLLYTSGAVVPAAILLNDSFSYVDGVLTNVAGGKWRHASGGAAQVNIRDGRVELTRSETEDVEASLSTSYAASSSGAIYFRFTLLVLSPPAGANGNYFAHLDGGNARARVFVVTNGAAPGRFRLGIAAGSSTASSIWSADLNTNETYTVMTQLAVSNVQVGLWVNPLSSSDTMILAADAASPSSVNRFAWRQDTGMGEVFVDDLVVASSFEEALMGNETPSISDIPDQRLAAGGSLAAIPFSIGDAESAADELVVSARVIPDGAATIVLGGTGSNRTISVSAGTIQTDQATVTIFVTDGVTTNSDSFVVTMIPALVLADDFSYLDGALIPAATPPWVHHSGGTTGQVEVLGGKVMLSGIWSEDVNVSLPGGPFSANSGVTLYASFVVNFRQPPGVIGDYFAHFNATGARCRLFANSANAAPGKFRLALANAAGSPSAQLTVDLSTNTDYRVVLRYNPAVATSKLWLGAMHETDLGMEASDVAVPTSISSFAFRQDPGIGALTVDELRIGLTFASVVVVGGPRLRIQAMPGAVRLAWPLNTTGLVLQVTGDVSGTNWQNSDVDPVIVGEENVITNATVGRMFFRLGK